MSSSSLSPRAQAIALRYKSGESAPSVIAKGYGMVAQNIMDAAHDHGVYIHESPELVELLMRVDLDSKIPPALYGVVAELLAWIYVLDGAAAKSNPGSVAPPSTGATAQ